MKSIGFKNFRGLLNTGEIELKPLTILVGKNSSGKSTFLRTFPLMKQTVITRRNEPILWYDKDFVDFGSFEESLNSYIKSENENGQDEKGIEMSFNINLSKSYFGRRGMLQNSIDEMNELSTDINLKFEIFKEAFKTIQFSFDGIIIKFKLKEFIKSKNRAIYSMEINGVEEEIELVGILRENFIPSLRVRFLNLEHSQEDSIYKKIEMNETSNNVRYSLQSISAFYMDVIRGISDKFLKDKYSDSLNQEELEEIQYKYIRKLRQLDLFKYKLFKSEIEEFIYETEEIASSLSIEEYENYEKTLFMIGFDNVIAAINQYLREYFKSIVYIAPVRASVERYYRIQGLAVDEIDPQGNNIAMVLNNFSEVEQKDFAQWCIDNFNFKIFVEGSNGHVNLKIQFSENNRLNLIDTGFGYSQILPIMLNIWNIERNIKKMPYSQRKIKKDLTIVIEQPELHLHPAMQCQMIDMFSEIIKKYERHSLNLKIIIETHSETIINRIGSRIVRDLMDKDDVNIFLFDNTNEYFETKIKKMEYDEDGIIVDWPIDFFYPEV